MDENPEIEPWVLEKFEPIRERLEQNERLFNEKFLSLIGLMSVRFNLLERDLKISLAILRRDQATLRRAYHDALKNQRLQPLIEKIKGVFEAKISEPAARKAFSEILQEADALRKERNLILHSVWRPTSDPEKPFVREKHDEHEKEVDFDLRTVQRLADDVNECRKRMWKFFNEQIPDYAELEEELLCSV
jgi:hypothetical protein